MAVHVSIRLFWHDAGWDGTICRDPASNVWCEAHEHVREHKPGEEVDAAGKRPDECGVRPGCEMSVQAFARHRNEIRVWPPEWMNAYRVQPVDIPVDAQSAPMWPFEEMWTEDGGHKSNDERREIVQSFLEQVEEGKSLAFFYVDERNPLFVDEGERSPARVLVGISRITRIGDISEWNEPTGDEYNMVWAVPFRHAFPKDGIRLPVQAIHSQVELAEDRSPYLVPLDGGIRTDFRYGSSRVSLDRAVVVVERAIVALDRIKRDKVIDQSVDQELAWLNERLLELWEDRGPYPGMPAVLRELGCTRSFAIQQSAIRELLAAGRDPANVVEAALDGDIDPTLSDFEDDLFNAGEEWSYLTDDERVLARLLMRMEIEPEQAKGVLRREQRLKHRLPGEASAVIANPYLLCEAFVPRQDHEPIAFETVDHALIPHEAMAHPGEHRVAARDPRRLRALLTDVLRKRGEDGDTFVSAELALEAAADRSPEDRRCEVPLDRLHHERVRPVIEETIEGFEADEVRFLALREICAHEQEIERVLADLASRERGNGAEIDWQAIAEQLAAEGAEAVTLSDEQVEALSRSYASPLSVLTGAAGTGKSTLLAPLVRAIEAHEGQVRIWALAPTGKAADRLKELRVQAMTIHRALAGAGWYDWDLGRFREQGDEPIGVDSLIIDEASMIDVELLATLFRAIDWHGVRRLVLVGDHHQLPPIGPGRPFYDLIALMTQADNTASDSPYRDRLNELTHNYRVQEGSTAVAFATGFARTPVPDEPQIWTSLAKGEDQGDLRVRFWADQEELYELVLREIEERVRSSCADAGLELEGLSAFDACIGHDARDVTTPFDAALWQLITPMRDWPHGSRKLNAKIQDRFHGWAKRSTRKWAPVSFGNEQITWHDKVIQRANKQLKAYHRETKNEEKRLVFNGQIGRVEWTLPRPFRKSRKAGETGNPRFLKVAFEGYPGWTFEYTKSGWRGVNNHLELAYALTVHKSQGSQFRHVYFVVPQAAASVFGRELMYTGLTRARDSLTLLVERDIGALLGLRKRQAATTPKRNSRLFAPVVGQEGHYRPDGLIHVTTKGDYVRSKSEVIIANLLHNFEISGDLSYQYEEELAAPGSDGRDLRLPDFTIRVGGKTFYWEHCGMVDDPAYQQRWEEVRLPWYKRHGFFDSLIVTEDGPGGTIDSATIEQNVIKRQILGRG